MLGSIWPSSSNSSNTFSSQNLWLIFGCKLEVASNSSTGAVLETPNVVNLSQSSWFLIGRAQDVFQKTVYTRCQEHTLFQREVIVSTLLIVRYLFSWFRSSDTNGWWLQVYQFWCHSLTSRIFFPIEFINSSLWRHSRFRKYFSAYFLYLSIPRAFLISILAALAALDKDRLRPKISAKAELMALSVLQVFRQLGWSSLVVKTHGNQIRWFLKSQLFGSTKVGWWLLKSTFCKLKCESFGV